MQNSGAPHLSRSLVLRSFPLHALTALVLLLPMAVPRASWAQTTGTSSALGESLAVHVLPLLGSPVNVSSGPLPTVSGSAPPAYNRHDQVASASASGTVGLLGSVLLHTGIIEVNAASLLPTTDQVSSDSTVNNLNLGLLGLLTLGAGTVHSTASISGCAAGPVSAGSANITGGTVGGTLGVGLTLLANPSPNTVLLNLLGVKVVLNEQVASTSGTTHNLTVNAIHVSLNLLGALGLGALSGDIVVAQAKASLTCAPVVNPPPPSGSDLAVTITASPSPANAGDIVTYTITVTNAGPDAAQNVDLTEAITGGGQLISVGSTQGSCSGPLTAIDCSLGTIPAGGQVIATVVVQTNAAGTLGNSAGVTSTSPDPDLTNNSASDSVTVNPVTTPVLQADLGVTGSVSPNPIPLNGVLTGTINVVNNGPQAATNAKLVIDLPAIGVLQSSSSSVGSCSGTGPLTCNFGTLASGATAHVTLVFLANTVGSMIFDGVGSSALSDPNSANNRVAFAVTVASTGGGGGTGPTGPTDPGTGTGTGPGTGGSTSSVGACAVSDVPAATLLIPAFSVDLTRTDGLTTLFSVTNTVSAPHLAKVTLWSDWAVPTLSFTIYLSGYDVQTFNVRDLFNGQVPSTSAALSPRGSLSDANINFAGCTNGPLALPGVSALPASMVSHLRAWHTGKASPTTGTCASSQRADSNIATGYVTVDVVRSCSALTAADPGYFGTTGVATYDNVLFGDYAFIDPSINRADGDTAVHIVADPDKFVAGDYTFYGRYVNADASDKRRPLGMSYATRYVAGGAFTGGTTLVVWRDTKSAAATGVACGTGPSWLPLLQGGIVAFDEDENSAILPASFDRAPAATQSLSVGSSELALAAPFGWVKIDLSHSATGLFAGAAQGWVSTTFSGAGRYSVGQRAIRLDSACDPR